MCVASTSARSISGRIGPDGPSALGGMEKRTADNFRPIGAKLLSAYDIRPGTYRFGLSLGKGHLFVQFDGAFARYSAKGSWALLPCYGCCGIASARDKSKKVGLSCYTVSTVSLHTNESPLGLSGRRKAAPKTELNHQPNAGAPSILDNYYLVSLDHNDTHHVVCINNRGVYKQSPPTRSTY